MSVVCVREMGERSSIALDRGDSKALAIICGVQLASTPCNCVLFLLFFFSSSSSFSFIDFFCFFFILSRCVQAAFVKSNMFILAQINVFDIALSAGIITIEFRGIYGCRILMCVCVVCVSPYTGSHKHVWLCWSIQGLGDY